MRRQGGEGALPLASNTQITRLHRFDGVLNSTRGAPSPRLRGEGWGEGALATNTLPHSILAQSLLTPRAGLFCVTLLTIALLALPLIWMAVLSLRYIIGIAETAGLALFWRAVIHDPVLLPALGNTILIGLLTAALACFAGAGLASLWQVWLQRGAWRLTLLTALPLLLPGIALGTLHLAAHFFLASWLPGDLGIIAVLAAETLRATPLAALVIAFAWSKAPAGFTETVIEFGLERRRAWTQLLAPFLRPAYPAAFAACFLLAAGDFQLGNALSGDLPLLSPAFLSGLAAQRSPVYMALVVPILALTAALSWLILTRLGARPVLPTALVPQAMMPTSKTTGTDVTITSSPASGAG